MNTGNKPCNRLYVGYLPPNITQKELEDLFGKYGTITEVRQNRNFAFIHYSDEPSAVNALTELSGQNHFGRKIDIQYARPPRNSGGGPDKKEGDQQRDRSPIGGRGGGRGGRGGGSFNSRSPFGGGPGGGNSGPFNEQSPFRGGDNSGGDRFGPGGRRGGGDDRNPPDLRSLSLPDPWVNQGPPGGGGGGGGPGGPSSGSSGPGGNPSGGPPGGAPGGGGGGPGPDPWDSGNRPGGGGGNVGNDFRSGGGPPDFRGGSDMRGGPDFREGFRDKGGPFGDRGRDGGPFGGGGRGDGPFGNRDGPPFGGRDSGPPFGGGGGGAGGGNRGRGDGPPFGRDGPPFGGGRDGPPFGGGVGGGGRDGPPPFGRDGPPFGGGRDGPPFGGGRDCPPFGGGQDGPPFGGGRDGPRGGGGGPMDFRDSPAFRGGARGDFPPQSSGGGWPSGSSDAPPNAEPAPLNVPNSERTNDIEIIVMNKSITDYGEYIESRLKSIGFTVDIMFPNETAPIARVLGNIASRGTLYAVMVNPQHKINRSLTLLILHGTPQEHRNMLFEDAIVFLNRNYENYSRSCQEKRGPNAPPEQVRQLLELIVSSSRQLTVPQFDILIQYFIQEKLKVEPPAAQENALPVSQQAELQTRILSILNKNTAAGGGPVNSNATPAAAAAPPSSAPKETDSAAAPSPLLKDPSVQRALDSLMQGGTLFRNINNSNASRY